MFLFVTYWYRCYSYVIMLSTIQNLFFFTNVFQQKSKLNFKRNIKGLLRDVLWKCIVYSEEKMNRKEERRLKKILFLVQKRFIWGLKGVKFRVYGMELICDKCLQRDTPNKFFQTQKRTKTQNISQKHIVVILLIFHFNILLLSTNQFSNIHYN